MKSKVDGLAIRGVSLSLSTLYDYPHSSRESMTRRLQQQTIDYYWTVSPFTSGHWKSDWPNVSRHQETDERQEPDVKRCPYCDDNGKRTTVVDSRATRRNDNEILLVFVIHVFLLYSTPSLLGSLSLFKTSGNGIRMSHDRRRISECRDMRQTLLEEAMPWEYVLFLSKAFLKRLVRDISSSGLLGPRDKKTLSRRHCHGRKCVLWKGKDGHLSVQEIESLSLSTPAVMMMSFLLLIPVMSSSSTSLSLCWSSWKWEGNSCLQSSSPSEVSAGSKTL